MIPFDPYLDVELALFVELQRLGAPHPATLAEKMMREDVILHAMVDQFGSDKVVAAIRAGGVIKMSTEPPPAGMPHWHLPPLDDE